MNGQIRHDEHGNGLLATLYVVATLACLGAGLGVGYHLGRTQENTRCVNVIESAAKNHGESIRHGQERSLEELHREMIAVENLRYASDLIKNGDSR